MSERGRIKEERKKRERERERCYERDKRRPTALPSDNNNKSGTNFGRKESDKFS
jgi:hypothetical protein